MSILKALGQTIIATAHAVEQVAGVADDLATGTRNVSGAYVDISGGWREDLKESSVIARDERKVARQERRSRIHPSDLPENQEPSSEDIPG